MCFSPDLPTVHPGGRSDERQHGGDGLLGLGDGGELGLDLGGAQPIAGRRGRRSRTDAGAVAGAAMTVGTAAAGSSAAIARKSTGGAVKSMQLLRAVHARRSCAPPASDCNTLGNRLRHRGRGARHAPQREHRPHPAS